MNDHVTDHLSAYLDDELDAAGRAAVDAHVAACADCAATLDSLRRIVGHAATVTSHDAPPSGELWSGILDRIECEAASASPRPLPFRQTRRVSMAAWQLAAAAVLLIAVSGATAWFLRGATSGTTNGSGAVIQAEIEPTPAADDVRVVNFADAQYDAAVADLEQALQERRNDLNPRTVEILERNLRLIDAAIAQARQALQEDPANTYLNRHLVESRRRKLELLRRATSISGD